MVNYGWFSYWDNPCHNAALDHGLPCLTMVIFISTQSLWQFGLRP